MGTDVSGYVTKGLRKRQHSTVVIIAKGLEFVIFDVTGSQMASGTTWRSLGLNNDGTQHPNGTPYNITVHTDQLQRVLLEIKAEAHNGDFEDGS